MPETQAPHGREDILTRIVATKRRELAALEGRRDQVERALDRAPPTRDFEGALRAGRTVAVMAEVKRRSPGAGQIRPGLEPAAVASGYASSGAAAISVLTDMDYFGGSLDDLRAVRDAAPVPVLRKDFTLDALQVTEARGAGADAVLLIARILDDAALVALREAAEALGMAALVEVHDGEEMARAADSGARIVGINNRDLRTFRTRLEVTLELLDAAPVGVLVVSESGIRTPADVERLGAAGVDAVLVGESLLRQEDPAAGAAALVGRPRRDRR
ncbi:MAG: indole-3-glycerol phosphate synthase TrpC [Gemmatimonadetes bacterium]|nr:indole-3-glycerol phosphate synthase TrpC [Gemmatimonadota bacterium]